MLSGKPYLADETCSSCVASHEPKPKSRMTEFLAKFQQEHNSDLERKFIETFDAATARINEKLAEASAALEEARKQLSEEHGIPFSSPIVENGDRYFPRSLKERWGSVGEKTLKEFFQFHELWREYGGYDTGYGWVTSYC